MTPRDIGRIGEQLARSHLEAKGYRIIASNYRCRWGEVDLVAGDGPVWVFVEVRTRRRDTYGSPEESITPDKVRRLTLTAQHYLAEHAPAADVQWRIDLVAVRLGRGGRVLSVRHLPNIAEG